MNEALRDACREAASVLASRKNGVALTGAGISVDSGIPEFRGSQGMWSKYDPMEYATIGAFLRDPEKVWTMLFEMMEVLGKAAPNPGHFALAEMERRGILHTVITQNVDGLHQAAGSGRVIEYHGNAGQLVCVSCWMKYRAREVALGGGPPRCRCGEVLKPGVVFFGEPIPWGPQEQAEEAAEGCGVLMLIGTSAQVTPACDIPRLAKRRGAFVIEVNLEKTRLTDTVTDLFLQGSSSLILPWIARETARD